MDKRSGGLDMRKLSNVNKDLLSKWCWRFACESDFHWKRVISRKYEKEEKGWCFRRAREGCRVGV